MAQVVGVDEDDDRDEDNIWRNLNEDDGGDEDNAHE